MTPERWERIAQASVNLEELTYGEGMKNPDAARIEEVRQNVAQLVSLLAEEAVNP